MYESMIDAELFSYIGASMVTSSPHVSLHPKNEHTLDPQKTVYIIYVGGAQFCAVIKVY